MDRWVAALACVAVLTACPDSHGDVVADSGTPAARAPGEGELCAPIESVPPPCADIGRGGACDSSAIARALSEAEPGDVVRVGACEVEGAWMVPPGVTLEGAGPDSTLLVGSAGEPVVTLEPGEVPATVRCLSVASSAPRGGVTMAGPGRATVAHSRVDVLSGIGVFAEDVDALRVHRVEVVGPFTADDVAAVPAEPDAATSATHGLALFGIGHAGLTQVTARGFAAMGVVLDGSELAWRGGDVGGNVGTGLFASGSRVCLRDVAADGELQGPRLLPAFGVAIASGSELRALRLQVRGSEGIGLFVSESVATVEEGLAESNAGAGVWMQGGRLELGGTVIDDNELAGILVCHAERVVLRDCTVARTRRAVRLTGASGRLEVGLGVGVARTGAAQIVRTRVESHETLGLLFDLEQDGVLPELSEVAVRAEGSALGALAYRRQEGFIEYLPLGSWDDGIVREGTAADNDAELVQGADDLSDRLILDRSTCLQHIPTPPES